MPASQPRHDEPPRAVASIPTDDPSTGLIYKGLRVAPQGDHCVGVLSTADGHCTHGPDAPPKGVDISKDTPPAATTLPILDARADQPPATPASAPGTGNVVAALTDQSVVCDGNGDSGNRVQVVYAHGPGRNRYAQYVASFRKWAAETDAIYLASAQETGGVRHIRFATAADCTPTVLDAELPDAAMAEFSAMNAALAQKGFNRKDRKYMVFADANVYCGIGTFNGDERPGQDNLSNFGPSYGRSDSGCWNAHTAAHELGHNLGAVNNSAPNSSKGAHCVYDWDLMCYSDYPYYPQMKTVCPDRAHSDRLDCTHDDYYSTDPKPGSYLASHWNVANNRFLIAGNGTKPDPNPTSSRSPNPSPTNTGPTTSPEVTVTQLMPNSAVVTWPAVNSADWYEVFLNGKHTGWVKQPTNRLSNLRPDTDYTIAVSVRDNAGRDSKPGRAVSFHTPKATS
ncbi:fibronectin type III domain-containing protein [Kitasatospora sp. NPDC093558]|uniref:fibronectin type III domain-containing protein n=1 Tax=Kitasatospora sp. NPDC093558 TaxID=3155201 RepID=UPI00342F2F2C